MSEIILVGDRILVDPDSGERQTESGLVLPASVAERDKVRGGRVVRVGPGYIIPNPEFSEAEMWAQKQAVRYLPLQAKPGDYAFFLRKEAIELTFQDHNYVIVSHGAILALIREEPDDLLSGIKPDAEA
ncbi:MAG: co-chaperone GroES [Rhodothermales bacterium]|nr:co-chaperone GroES [Rhodothermales bacterium]MBO6780546.1 co-chaperone GroES [Rhodothermales bacterium]